MTLSLPPRPCSHPSPQQHRLLPGHAHVLPDELGGTGPDQPADGAPGPDGVPRGGAPQGEERAQRGAEPVARHHPGRGPRTHGEEDCRGLGVLITVLSTHSWPHGSTNSEE